jgi:hypothetical protein
MYKVLAYAALATAVLLGAIPAHAGIRTGDPVAAPATDRSAMIAGDRRGVGEAGAQPWDCWAAPCRGTSPNDAGLS